MSVRLRLTLWFLAILCGALFLFATSAEILMSRSLYRSLDESLVLMAEQADSTLASEDGEVVSVDEMTETVRTTGDFLVVMDANGQTVQGWGLYDTISGLDTLSGPNPDTESVFYTMLAKSGDEYRVLATGLGDDEAADLLVLVGRRTEVVETVLASFRQVAIIAVLLTIGLAGAGGVFLANRALRPVEEIAQTAREIQGSDLSRRIQVSRNDELGRLSETLNQMIARLERSFNRMSQFTGDASHELRTPMAVIRAEATLALRRQRGEAGYREALATISREAEYMSGLLDKLLGVARMEQGAELPVLERVSLKQTVDELLVGMASLFAEADITVSCSEDGDAFVMGDPVELRQLFVILLDNARKFTPPGGKVTVSWLVKDDSVTASIQDTGIGIPEEHLPHIFEDFYRVDKVRSRASGSVGLGLSIASRIAEAHGGSIEAESKYGQGSTFRVVLRAAMPDTAAE